MLENSKISLKQIVLLIFINRIIITITYLPALNSPPANQDIWISEILSFPLLLILSMPVYLLWKKFPQNTVIQSSEAILGKAGGKIIGILYVWFFIHITAINIILFGQFIVTAIMPETPILFIIISMTAFCAYAVTKGIETIGRLCEIIGPIIIISIITIVVLVSKDMDLKALMPMMEKGFFPVLSGGFTTSARTYGVLTIAMILPYLNDKRKAKLVYILTYLIIIIFFLIVTIPILGIHGVEKAKLQSFPFFRVVRLVNVGDFIERIDAIHVGIWVLGVFINVSFIYYLTVLGMTQVFNLKDYKPLVVPTSTIIIPLCILLAPNVAEIKVFLSYKIYTWYVLFYTLLIPSILLVIAIIRKKGEPLK